MEPSSAPAGWHPDPTGRFEFRYFNGERWTSDVAVHGQRFVDQPDRPTNQPGWDASAPSSRNLALASFWVAFGSFLLGWVPFAFLIAVPGAITSFVFGVIALRRVRRVRLATGTGRGHAIAGVLLSLAALGASAIGFAFTRTVMTGLDALFDIGPHSEQVDSCILTDGLVRLDGSITNNDDQAHRYAIDVGYRSEGALIDVDRTVVDSVRPGETAHFHTSAFVSAEQLECTIEAVNTPTPFTFGS